MFTWKLQRYGGRWRSGRGQKQRVVRNSRQQKWIPRPQPRKSQTRIPLRQISRQPPSKPVGRQLVRAIHQQRRPVPQARSIMYQKPKPKPKPKINPKTKKQFQIEQYTSIIQQELANAPRPNIDLKGPSLQWPQELTPIFAISLRTHRYNNLLERMKQWSRLITLMPATDGRQLTPDKWKQLGRLRGHLANGQIGCYESHARVWQRIVDQNLGSALVLEDDAAITYTQDTVDRLKQFLSELKTIPFDVAYIGNIGLHPAKQQLSKNIVEPSNWEGLYTYYITREGARKLLQKAFPITQAVDLFVGQQAREGTIRTVSMTPPLNFVVPVESDTDKRVLR